MVGAATDSIVPEEDPLLSQLAVGGRGRVVRADVRRDFALKSTILGTGVSGAVCLAEHRITKKRVAVKSFRLHRLRDVERRMLEDEVNVYMRLDHPNVCRLLHLYEQSGRVWLVMELCRCDLYDRLRRHGPYAEREAAHAMVQMLRAVNYLHSHNIVHRDLKLENWMYGYTERGNRLKLIDFGFSRILNDASQELHLSCGTLPYLSPERLRLCYTSRSDIWSLGVICYELLFARPPFHAHNDKQLVEQIMYGDVPRCPGWSSLSAAARCFIESLLCKDASRRPDAAAALQHPWLVKMGFVSGAPSEETLAAVSGLSYFAHGSRLQRAALTLLAHSLTSFERDDLERVFLEVDSEGRGTISFAQLASVLRNQCPDLPDFELKNIFDWLDVFDEGEIHCTPFVAALLPSHVRVLESKVRDAFKVFDATNSGFITADALMCAFSGLTLAPASVSFLQMQETCRRGFAHMTREEAERWISEADSNGSSSIDFEGFVEALMGRDRRRRYGEGRLQSPVARVLSDMESPVEPAVPCDSRSSEGSTTDVEDDVRADCFALDQGRLTPRDDWRVSPFGSAPPALRFVTGIQPRGYTCSSGDGVLHVRSLACFLDEEYFSLGRSSMEPPLSLVH